MKHLLQFIMIICLCQFSVCHAATSQTMVDKNQLQHILHAVCSIGQCDQALNPYNDQDADEIISNGAYIVYATDYERLEKYNAQLKGRRSEGTLFVPAKWVEAAVCKYYGFDLNKYPELNKSAKKLVKNGHFPVGIGDPGIMDFEIEKMNLLKNGLLRASGKTMEEDPFVAYFDKSNCGGKQHWALIRVVYPVPREEGEDYRSPFK